ncbi:uncharacterized protein HD556DRAFT_1408777 [Suillus plorans]|uniref:Ig-like domain-containing protein n=1 Tax=Suillus plorans TaxID=116603 RepID=A0A9P7DCP7_9AGAM|nr:uncharacterized protein HD556DRAFT_1408777 [Suillus plorans]KAG1787490.1 hypothetical protein HD556DRAFT_1408777 [Suillus plorans]
MLSDGIAHSCTTLVMLFGTALVLPFATLTGRMMFGVTPVILPVIISRPSATTLPCHGALSGGPESAHSNSNFRPRLSPPLRCLVSAQFPSFPLPW